MSIPNSNWDPHPEKNQTEPRSGFGIDKNLSFCFGFDIPQGSSCYTSLSQLVSELSSSCCSSRDPKEV
jgi:hypothetical protein